jgi:hypothetical protein
MLHQTFLAIIIWLQFTLALLDHMITNGFAKGLPPDDGRFHAYVLTITLLLLPFAALAYFTEPTPTTALLKAWTVMLTWFGGFLDWIYFIAKTVLPLPDKKWRWMPKIFPRLKDGVLLFDYPTNREWAIYTVAMWLPNIICWIIVFTV